MNWMVVFLIAILGIVVLVGQQWIDSNNNASLQEPIDTAIPVGEGVIAGRVRIVNEQDRPIRLVNNPLAKNPTWDELKGFLMVDQTDRQLYVSPSFTCGDYAEMLHNKAEASQIRAAFVTVGLLNLSNRTPFHALNAFEVIDRGLVYIDDTGAPNGAYADKVVEIVEDTDYNAIGLFPEIGQSVDWMPLGNIEHIIQMQW